MYNVINGKVVASKIRTNLKNECDMLKENNITPKFAVILVGDNNASKIYVKNKSKASEEVGIEFVEYVKDKNITQTELLNLIDTLNNDKSINGILLQSPIPSHLDVKEAFEAISHIKDVDGFNPLNAGKLLIGQDCFVACTPKGILRLLQEYNIELEGKNVVIVGRSNIVGKPVAQLLLNQNATVTICHSKTQNLESYIQNADVIVAAIGKPQFITANMIKEGAVVIDVGINRLDDGSLVGDVDFHNVKEKASYITPVPGGVGPMTIAMLLENVIEATKNQNA